MDQSELLPLTTPLYSLIGNEVLMLGQVRLVVSFGEEPLKRTRVTNFIAADAPSAYNVILGRPTLNEFWAVISTYCQKIKFPMDDKVGEVRSDQLTARRCYVEMVRSETRVTQKNLCLEVNTITEKPLMLAYEEKEEFQIHPSRSETTTFIVIDLESAKKEELVTCLRQNYDVFAWSMQELPGISSSVAWHKLHVQLDARSIKQKKKDFSTEQNLIIRAEIEKLLEVDRIREVQLPS
ncbi:uncharacterized protein LOC122042916 [Zingiber officinale]|uniref:uncharacterized protein LOC122042916 n=1 Tax=Zingiber officinale TaxID=94328 RepID=UPI001C4D3594|nr:uncharacterized protein LOC122042916 [Zingiber officinale]